MSAPIIFTLGFDDHAITGGEPPDLNMLKLMANDPNSPVAFSNRINGRAYIAADVNAVGMALQQIRSQILRLSQ
jgi:hypothetical protein